VIYPEKIAKFDFFSTSSNKEEMWPQFWLYFLETQFSLIENGLFFLSFFLSCHFYSEEYHLLKGARLTLLLKKLLTCFKSNPEVCEQVIQCLNKLASFEPGLNSFTYHLFVCLFATAFFEQIGNRFFSDLIYLFNTYLSSKKIISPLLKFLAMIINTGID
jgi:hypothetical protein